jgi:pentapeptide MXKDX repeat protein
MEDLQPHMRLTFTLLFAAMLAASIGPAAADQMPASPKPSASVMQSMKSSHMTSNHMKSNHMSSNNMKSSHMSSDHVKASPKPKASTQP